MADEMDPAALSFLDSADLQKIAITWPKVTRWSEDDNLRTKLPGSDVWFLISEWSEKAGVSTRVIESSIPVFAAHNIILPDGSIPKAAVAYIRRQVAKRLK